MICNQMIYLKTERTIIRDHVPDDLPTHHQLLSDPQVMHYLPDIATDSFEASKINLQNAIDAIQNPQRTKYFLRIEERQTKAHIGEIGYTVSAFTPVGKLAGAGYFIHKAFWGQGYTSEALAEVMRFAFEENGVFRISCGCDKENAASERVMQRCGMIQEADRRACFWHDGRMKDRVEYRLLQSEWMAKHRPV